LNGYRFAKQVCDAFSGNEILEVDETVGVKKPLLLVGELLC
jgi:hypothetical protein